ncbi:hypothetical protein EXIGLDRAFT_90692 [Exidia glandulosa HHB12029]|uniref:Uncharacterized protein n=1 Tax=Exidia glandulosa HHB12029 TaxID=1314781 RepID=A0A165HCG0_EXIGL|nr:hypothetical protein EXIGLDRAFT_90692 [Exidia glandulosa HHB12029]
MILFNIMGPLRGVRVDIACECRLLCLQRCRSHKLRCSVINVSFLIAGTRLTLHVREAFLSKTEDNALQTPTSRPRATVVRLTSELLWGGE